MRNKIDHLNETLNEFNLDVLCLTETWLYESDLSVIRSALPKSYTIISIPRPMIDRPGGGVTIIYSRVLSRISHCKLDFAPTFFECLEVEINHQKQTYRIAIVYRPGHRGTDRIFMEEFGQFLEAFTIKSGCLIICGDFNYWIDNPTLKPFSSEFLDLICLNNLSKYVSQPNHLRYVDMCWI